MVQMARNEGNRRPQFGNSDLPWFPNGELPETTWDHSSASNESSALVNRDRRPGSHQHAVSNSRGCLEGRWEPCSEPLR